MELAQHIDELRAELSWNADWGEIARIEAELAAALGTLEREREAD